MFDCHMHSRVSFDGHDSGLTLARAAVKAGLKEICFTDHLDYDPLGNMGCLAFDVSDYSAEYDNLEVPGLSIRRGMEFGLALDNAAKFREELGKYPYDFVLGSIHFVDDLDVYYPEWWAGKTIFQAEHRFLEATLDCVRVHEDFDVLAHLTYIGKATSNPVRRPLPYAEHGDVMDEIMKILIQKGKGMELNTSGVDRCGEYLPSADILRRFKELGGEIVTIGSDAHRANRVGQYSFEACQVLKDIFGYVCTFQNRLPVFHKL